MSEPARGRRSAEPHQHGCRCRETHPLGWSRQRRRPYGLWGNMFCKKEACFWRKERVSFSLATPFSGWPRLPCRHRVLCCPDWYSARPCIHWAARAQADSESSSASAVVGGGQGCCCRSRWVRGSQRGSRRFEMLESLYLRLGLEPVSMCAKAFSRVRLCDPTDHSPPGSSVHDILQARILEWIAMPSSRESPEPNPSSRIEPEIQSPSLAGWFFTTGTARETLNPCSGTQAEPKP